MSRNTIKYDTFITDVRSSHDGEYEDYILLRCVIMKFSTGTNILE
jgi:hypothetical protein